jgi:death-on-curing protein
VIEYLSIRQILRIHELQIERFGGADGLRDRGALEAAVARPRMTFDGEDLYPELADKAAALLHSLVQNHPFVDGNKRAGAMAAELFLIVNDHELHASDDELEATTLAVARGELAAEALAIWFRQRLVTVER